MGFAPGVITYPTSGTAKTNGYQMGGTRTGSDLNTTKIRKMVFSTEVVTDLSATLPGNKLFAGSTGAYSSTKGYDAGGSNDVNTANRQTSIYDLTFSGETSGTTGVSLGTARTGPGQGQSSTAGYFVNGNNPGALNTCDKLVFSGETISTLTNTVYSGGFGSLLCSQNFAIYTGGNNGSTYMSNTARLTFSTDAFASGAHALTDNRAQSAAVYTTSRGYNMGGYNNTNLVQSAIERTQFSDETNTVIAATLTTGVGAGGSVSSSTKGYSQGGNDDSVLVNKNYTLTFSTETAGSATNTMTEQMRGSAGVSN